MCKGDQDKRPEREAEPKSIKGMVRGAMYMRKQRLFKRKVREEKQEHGRQRLVESIRVL